MGEENDSEPESWRHHRHGHFMKHWMRHAAMVPKGYLRYQLLNKLNEKPMSGSEIMSELESETRGYWRPSPGSIYPLLAWLQDQKLITEAEQTEPGIRRYKLTDSGKTFLQTETKSREEINKNLQSLGNMWYGPRWRNAGETGKTAREFFRAVRELHHELRRDHPKEIIEPAKLALEEATNKVQEATRILRGR